MAILAVSREFMSGADEICRVVAQELRYEYVDKEVILADLKAAGKRWERAGEESDESAPSLWERHDWAYRGFTALVESQVYEKALKNNCVIMGRGSTVLLHGIAHALTVRIFAPFETRVQRLMARDSVNRETAEWLVGKVDKAREGYIRGNYVREWRDMVHYDMIINTESQLAEQAEEMLMKALNVKEGLHSPDCQKVLEERALAARIKAKVLTHEGLFVPTLEVAAKEGVIVLKGVIHNAREHLLIEDLAKKTAGQMPVRCELHYRR
jgi:hypothetical protein